MQSFAIPARSAADQPSPAPRSQRWLPAFSHSDLSRREAGVELEGSLPAWLQGRLLRTAPALFEAGGFRARHWFDGIGMLYSFAFDRGGVRFAQRALESEALDQARAGRVRTTSFASVNQRSFWQRVLEPIPAVTDNANVNVIRMGDEWVAMTESPHQLSVDASTLETRGRVRYDDALPAGLTMTAHPHFDFERERVVNVGLNLGRKAELVAYDHAPASRSRREIARVRLPEAPYVHSFGLTREDVVLIAHPFRAKPASFLWSNRGFIDHFRWQPERGTQLLVLDRAASAGAAPRVFETEAFFVFHTVNTFRDGPDLVLDLLAYRDPGIVTRLEVSELRHGFARLAPELRRIRMRQGGAVQSELLLPSSFEFPIVSYRKVSGKRHRFVWGSTAAGDGHDVMRLDCESGQVRSWGKHGYRFGEPVFVSEPGAPHEDGGVLLTTGSNESDAVLAVLDARTLEPRALVHVDVPIPLGFHGSFARE